MSGSIGIGMEVSQGILNRTMSCGKSKNDQPDAFSSFLTSFLKFGDGRVEQGIHVGLVLFVVVDTCINRMISRYDDANISSAVFYRCYRGEKHVTARIPKRASHENSKSIG